jgi:hypothetical protein
MKIYRRWVIISLALAVISSFVAAQSFCAETLNSPDAAAKIVKQDTGVKAQIKEVKQKIAVEREAILAAGRRLSQVKKTGDKPAIEQAKKEVDAEIRERKSAISVLKTDIERLQGSSESLAPGRKGRSEEGR